VVQATWTATQRRFQLHAERRRTIVEIYYRYRISKQFELSPDFQYLGKLGGNPEAKTVKVVGLRAQISF